MNSITLIGNLGKDPTMQYTPAGVAVTNFSIAVRRPPIKGQEQKPIWFGITCWDAKAESANQYLQKGSLVAVRGRLEADENGYPRTFKLKDGGTGSAFDVTAQEIEYLSGTRNKTAPEQGKQYDYNKDEIPF